MRISSSTAVLASALLTFAGDVFGQTHNNTTAQSGLNFYITTPQTGERVSVGETNRPATQVASASANSSVNTYLQQQPAPWPTSTQATTRRPQRQDSSAPSSSTRHPAYSIQQVSNSPAPARASSRQSSPYVSNTRSGQTAVSTSAGNHNYYTHNHQPAATTSNRGATTQKRSLFSRVIHPRHDTRQQQQQVNTSAIKPSKHNGTRQQGVASWYGPKWHGRKTASGERFDMNSMTAAHKTLPFGTLVKVRNERNGRECIVRINNRGPFTKGRIIDLSKAAASQIGMVGSGIAKVTCEVVGRS